MDIIAIAAIFFVACTVTSLLLSLYGNNQKRYEISIDATMVAFCALVLSLPAAAIVSFVKSFLFF